MLPLGRLHQQMIARKIILVKGFTLLYNNKIMVELFGGIIASNFDIYFYDMT